MKIFRGEPVALTVGVLAFIAPILLSLLLAWNQSIANQKAEGLRYAAEVVRRGQETGWEFYRAAQLLNQDNSAPCSPPDIDLMRQLDVGSSYIQMVGRVSGDRLQCSSLGVTGPVALGKPTVVTENGVSEWMDFRLGSVPVDRLDLLEFKGVAVVVDTRLLVDQETEEGVQLALMVPSTADHLRLVEPKGPFQSNWFTPIGRGQAISFVDGKYIVSQVRSRNMDIQAISVIPVVYSYRRVTRFALIFVPIGLLCGAVLGWAVLQLLRIRSSVPGLIRAAARNRNFFVEYQPVVELSTRRIIGAEALVRWRRGKTVIAPAGFIKLAEDSGVISLITDSVLNIVARDLPRLLKLDRRFRVAVNLSATDLKDDATKDKLIALLGRSGGLPENLIVEATEHGLVSGSESQRIIEGIRAEGVCVAIDDFGTGYSTLSCLQSLSLDFLKIDKTFVDTIGTDGATSEVVLHIIEIARSLHLRTVAEGVETEAQAEFLLQRNVDHAQGWLFGKPMSIESLCDQLGAADDVANDGSAVSRIKEERGVSPSP